MKIVRVVPARSWFNVLTGQTASLYGACPWASEADRRNWELRTTGYTWELSNGTIGIGRQPVGTEAEAVALMDRHNARFGSK